MVQIRRERSTTPRPERRSGAPALTRRARLRLLPVAAVLAALLTPLFSGAASATTNPSPGPFPPGTNACRPTAAHPYPVVLVHGTFENAAQNWAALAPFLQSQGYCVYALNYGANATGDIRVSAQQLKTFVEKFVLPATGAKRVDMVGHSQGGLMPRYYINKLGGASKVNELIGLSPSNHGTKNPLAPYAVNCPACLQQVYESSFIRSVNSPAETRDAVDYTVIQTRYDDVVLPYSSAFLHSDDGNVTNVLLQNKCPADTSDHLGIPFDPVAFQWVANALARQHAPADPNFRPVCA